MGFRGTSGSGPTLTAKVPPMARYSQTTWVSPGSTGAQRAAYCAVAVPRPPPLVPVSPRWLSSSLLALRPFATMPKGHRSYMQASTDRRPSFPTSARMSSSSTASTFFSSPMETAVDGLIRTVRLSQA